jgi:N-acetylglucosaminyl-diphospho-decaprenol L-rhamnosyltransferase
MDAPQVGIAVTTRDRRDVLLATLERLLALPQRPPVVVVDNASRDGTVEAVRRRFPAVEVHGLDENVGAAARTLAAERLPTPLVAFADDDSWWADDALDVIARTFAEHPRLGLLAGRVLVGEEERLDPTCTLMSDGPLDDGSPPGPRVLGFVACGAAVRRTAFLEVGGFERRLGIGGEETLLSIDLASAGWELRYVDAAVAYHHPGTGGPRPGREAIQRRNALWTLWLRRPVRRALAGTLRALGRPGAGRALAGAAWAARSRRPAPARVERDLRALEQHAG